MRTGIHIFLGLSLIMTGAMFGFFFAYVASGINGLSTMPGTEAINAMNAINGAIRNAQFFPFFFLTPVVCLLGGGLAGLAGQARTGVFLCAAGLTYALGGIGLTMAFNVPLNQNLMALAPDIIASNAADQIWADYARNWSFWNLVRTVFSGIALGFVGIAIAERSNT